MFLRLHFKASSNAACFSVLLFTWIFNAAISSQSAAMVRFLYWLKQSIQVQWTASGKEYGREQSAAEQACRKGNMRPLTEIRAAPLLEPDVRKWLAEQTAPLERPGQA